MSAQVAADLRAAAEVLRRDGWTQGDYEADDGCRCVKGAIHVATTGSVDSGDGEPDVLNAYTTLWRFLGTGPMVWNDAPGRTADEVITALLAAADAAEAQS